MIIPCEPKREKYVGGDEFMWERNNYIKIELVGDQW